MSRSSETQEVIIEKPDLFTGESPVESAHNTWAKVQKDLAYALGQNVHRSWTGRLHISGADAYKVVLTAPTKFIASKIESCYADELRRLWKKHDQVAPPREVVISKPVIDEVKSDGHHRSNKVATRIMPSLKTTSSAAPVREPFKSAGRSSRSNRRERYTFDNFIVGPSNEFAVAAARQIANQSGAQYNPIVLHGDNGMGKTHLVYAIENAIAASDHPVSVLKVSGEEFVNTFVSSLRGGGRDAIDAFKAKLRNVDVLMIDDVHFIASKRGSQEELLHTLVSLVGAGRQVLLTSDKHPDDLEGLSGRLQSYLTSGLVCKIGAADYELRLRILDSLIYLRRKSGHANLEVPKKVRDMLAARVNATPRDLEGAFNQVMAKSDFLGTPITVETVQQALSEGRYRSSTRLTVDFIQRMVAKEYNISLDDMVSKRRARVVSRPRQIAMYLCKTLTQRSLPDIGRRFGGRDHTTVMHAVKRINELRATDDLMDQQINRMEQSLKGQ